MAIAGGVATWRGREARACELTAGQGGWAQAFALLLAKRDNERLNIIRSDLTIVDDAFRPADVQVPARIGITRRCSTNAALPSSHGTILFKPLATPTWGRRPRLVPVGAELDKGLWHHQKAAACAATRGRPVPTCLMLSSTYWSINRVCARGLPPPTALFRETLVRLIESPRDPTIKGVQPHRRSSLLLPRLASCLAQLWASRSPCFETSA